MLKRLFGQVILCTKEVSVGARKNAFTLLVEMGRAFLRFGSSQEGETVGYKLGWPYWHQAGIRVLKPLI